MIRPGSDIAKLGADKSNELYRDFLAKNIEARNETVNVLKLAIKTHLKVSQAAGVFEIRKLGLNRTFGCEWLIITDGEIYFDDKYIFSLDLWTKDLSTILDWIANEFSVKNIS